MFLIKEWYSSSWKRKFHGCRRKDQVKIEDEMKQAYER